MVEEKCKSTAKALRRCHETTREVSEPATQTLLTVATIAVIAAAVLSAVAVGGEL